MGDVPSVLVCDDDPLIRHLLQQALEFGGYDVTTASDGAEAIAKIHAGHTFDVLVTDYNMPRSNGIEVIAHVQSVDASLPCIIVTAFRDLDLAMKAMQAGAVGFVPKPFKADHLLMVMQRACDRRVLEIETMRLRLLTPMLERFTMVLANTLETKDLSTQRHSERLVYLADSMAIRMGLSPDERAALRLGACLHDIGKVGIPELILNKREILTQDEYELIKEHPTIGARILEDIDAWEDVRLIVRHHHEHYDGGGYPSGLSSEQIPVGARIVSVADAFDVMRSGRIYCAPKPIDEIVHELTTLSGRQFDPDVVSAFMQCLDDKDPLLRPLDGDAQPKHQGAKVGAHWLLGETVPTIPHAR